MRLNIYITFVATVYNLHLQHHLEKIYYQLPKKVRVMVIQ